MDFASLIKDLQIVCKQNLGHEPHEDDVKSILCGLLSIRDTECLLKSSPRHLFQVLCETNEFYNRFYIPLDTVSLRGILQNKKIQNISKIMSFNNFVMQRIIKDQKIHLAVHIDPCKLAKKLNLNTTTAGGICIFDTNCLDISDQSLTIVVNSNDPNITNIVRRIAKDCKSECEIYTNSTIPGLDKYKFAAKLNRYKIDIPSMNIHNEVARAATALEALDSVLAYKWHWHPDKHLHKRKPERYTAEFWQNSGFFESIVKKANANFQKHIVANSTFTKSLKLTSQESLIFETLLDINKTLNLGITFRVAGGWVRDKLLNKPSDDLDIALDKMTGQSFVQQAIEYKKMNPSAPIEVDSSYVVKQNVEKSKHLEVTALEIANLKIDFVNLRSETYGDSRVPTMQLSDDPKIDAQRRDLTINSLFYNVNNSQIEDYVGGLSDLKNMILRTPLDPIKTFKDDPLRILRVLRFNSRYEGSKIDPSIIAAMEDKEVQAAYANKVAPERAGPEIVKLFQGENPANSLRILFETNMDQVVFATPETKKMLPLQMDQRTSHHQHNLLEHTLRVVENLNSIMKQKNVNKNDRANMLMAALFHDYGKAYPGIGQKKKDSDDYSYHGHEDKSAELADDILKRIGIGENDRKLINLVIKQHMRPHTDVWSDKAIGKFMRETQIAGNPRTDLWELIMMHAQADTLASRDENKPDYDLKEKHIEQMREYLKKPISQKPLLDGSEIQKMFPQLSPKPFAGQPSFIKYIQNLLLDEQSSGNIKTEDDARNFVASKKQEIEKMYSQPKKSFNISKLKKESDASSGAYTNTGGRMVGEGTPAEWHGVKRMIYRNDGDSALIALGDKYRKKSLGAALQSHDNDIYTVVGKSTGSVVLRDKNGKKFKVEIGVELPARFIKV